MARKKKTQTPTLNPRVALPLVVLAAFALRFWLMHYRFAVAFDEVNYLKLGVSGHLRGLSAVLHTYWSPLLPALVSLSSAIFRDYEFAGRFVSLLAGALLPIPIYFLGKHIYGRNVGLIAATLVAFFPPLAFQSTQILTEPVLMLLAAWAILWGLVLLERESVTMVAATGVVGGLLYLTHPLGVGFVLVTGCWVLSSVLRQRSWHMLVIGLTYVGAFLVTASPYLLYLKNKTGVWTLSAKSAANQQFEAYEATDGADPFRSWDPKTKSVPIDLIYHQGTFLQASDSGKTTVSEIRPGKFVKKYVGNVYEILKRSIPQTLTTLPMLLLGVGLLAGPLESGQGKKVLFLLSFLGFFWLGVIPAFHITERYLTPLLPICFLWVAHGVLIVFSWMSEYGPLERFAARIKRPPSRVAGTVLVLMLFLFSFFPELSRVLAREPNSRDFWGDPVEQKRAGLWLKEHATAPRIIMSRNHTVDIYAGNYNIADSVTLPTSRLESVLEYAKYRGVHYIVLNERYAEVYPHLRALFHGEVEVPDLSLIYDETDETGLATRIFEVRYR